MLDWALETGLLPDAVIRAGIRRLLEARLREQRSGGLEAQRRRRLRFIEELRESPVAIQTSDANAQHYEVPAAFFERVLGPRMKYSAAHWPEGVSTLEAAEEAMLALTAERARIEDGQSILELGCGWGSLSLYLAERFPNARITGVSNSASQKQFIDSRSRRRGLANLRIVTADMNSFQADGLFDRVVSVEMFEHMRNHRELMRRISRWLHPGGFLFVHIFTHRLFAYPYESRGPSDWMARHFFTGGIMPSWDLLLEFPEHMRLVERWNVNGVHYQRTLEAWLAKMDADRTAVLEMLGEAYGKENSQRWWMRWRVFFMACSELFGYRDGAEWGVSHYLFERATAMPD